MKRFFKNLVFNKIKSISIVKFPDLDKLNKFLFGLRPRKIDNLIRIGSNFDGGYLVPNYLEGISDCFSPGVFNNVSFELFLANKNIRCHLADASIDSLPIEHKNFYFQKKYVGSYEKDEYISFDKWIELSKPSLKNDWILQMDIEGDEFNNIINMSNEIIQRFRIIVIEIHDFHKILDSDYLFLFESIFEKLRRNHSIVHLHINNCLSVKKFQGTEIPQLLELTFLRNDYITSNEYISHSELPNPLDQPCVPDLPENKFPKWF